MGSYKFIDETLKEKYSHLDLSKNPWRELIKAGTGYKKGWHDLVIQLMQEIEIAYDNYNEPIENLKIHGIKEKYGGLQVDIGDSENENLNTVIYGLVDQYEENSYSVCVECGSMFAELCKNDRGCLQALCPKCAEKLEYQPESKTLFVYMTIQK
ncbi:hypothetical protein [Candidatus Formimonas warabiya]|uniref:Uncharacterized protein n=1 Tax=Formimonas warabiya TaxID=1761012 RepID=A0A3G1KTX9_FORW1|nr:hypothetical protein [Candidatus Formimonas warabiya]ATW25625.1 hypothetical protein DCMF_13415 [Candidatus Formimonas warabiya]